MSYYCPICQRTQADPDFHGTDDGMESFMDGTVDVHTSCLDANRGTALMADFDKAYNIIAGCGEFKERPPTPAETEFAENYDFKKEVVKARKAGLLKGGPRGTGRRRK